MNELATYSFLPWLRQGIANQIQPTIQAGGRATIPIDLVLSGEPIQGGNLTLPAIHKDIQLYGPGDVIGLDQRAILKAEPRNWITNFEPNYLPFIEFYDEGLPWRYSPYPNPINHRLIPWLALIVLEEGEFAEGENRLETPLPFITLTAPEPLAVLPPSDQLWAWAHVQVNRDLVDAVRSIEDTLTDALAQNPDLAYSRLLCPRRLRPQAAYTAFVVPVFENGRQAGLGVKPDADWNQLAWEANQIPDRLPYYHRWYFRTGTVGDFEYLVRLLEPKPVDSRVGVRSMDVQQPGANLKGITDPALNGVLKLGGALQIPRALYTPAELTEVEKYESWATPYPHPFQKSLAAFINLAPDYQTQSAETANTKAGAKIQEEIRPEPDRLEEDPQQPPVAEETYTLGKNRDPLITAPLYGQWHSLTQRLLEQPDGSPVSNPTNWVHQLNLDPRWRASAGLGTKVVQQNPETYLKAAWEQLGAVLEANKKIRAAQLALAVSQVWYTTHLRRISEVSADQWLTLAAPLSKRILLNGKTIFQTIRQSNVPLAVTSVPMRQLMRPRGPLAKRLARSATGPSSRMVSRLARGEITAAPPKTKPTGAILLQSIAELVQAIGLNRNPKFLQTLKDVFPTLKEQWDQLEKVLPAYQALSEEEQKKNTEWIVEAFQHPDWIDQLPGSSDFRLIEPGSPDYQFNPTGTDNELAKQYKQAMRELLEMIQRNREAGYIPPKPVLAIELVSKALLAGTDPALTIPRWTWSGIQLPERFRRNQQEPLAEVMAYPEFDLPMYKPLAALSSEFFLPNINQLAQNSLSLLETNQPFIEAYMVGLNHEFARELLWREYPTDQRGSYFRQFWGVNDFMTNDPLTPEERREKQKDIPPLHRWSNRSQLGDHDQREANGTNEQEVVLAIRGELLKKYPTAVIYAHRAEWIRTSTGTIDLTKPRQLASEQPQNGSNRSSMIIKMPLYEAKVEPDIYFFGFDITVCAAKGGSGKQEEPANSACAEANISWDDPGWFFVIRERPGEPRFGLDAVDTTPLPAVEVWNDLSWNHLSPSVPEGGFIQVTENFRGLAPPPLLDPKKMDQYKEDLAMSWNPAMSSADLAYILYQVPVLVAVHASDMLPDQKK